MELAGLLLRVAVSLGLVLAVLWFAAKGLRSSQRRSRAGVDVDVLTRQPLAQKSSLAVVRLGDRALVLGVTESRVELLHETALADVLVPYQPTDADLTALENGPATTQEASRGAGGAAASRATVPTQLPPTATGRPSLLKARGVVASQQPQGPLAGSALSPQTWSRAVQVLREKTVRR
jgi:flagellar protein FliO/FliZ